MIDRTQLTKALAHEAHGSCLTCGYPVHAYPFGWQHVGAGMFSCAALVADVTCCALHAERSDG